MLLLPLLLLLLVVLLVLQVEGMELMVDAFNGGELTALQDAEEVLGRLIGYQVIHGVPCYGASIGVTRCVL
jgi:hypothetical protein